MSSIDAELRGARVLDLFAGSGALGIEALSRGAAFVTFVESAGAVLTVLRKNLDALGVPAATYRVHRGDAFRYLEALAEPVDVAFADPPYASGAAAELASVFRKRPFAELFCLEHASRERIDADPVRERRYGDTTLTFLRAPHDET
jgi:16S rRNA (guanine966-N2)-methyltransferase